MSTVTRRRIGGVVSPSNNANDGRTDRRTRSSSHEANSPTSETKIACDPQDVDESKSTPRLTLMEEVLLLGLKDKQGYLSFWNDSISYALRGCILIELAFRGRIAMVKDVNRRKDLLADRCIELVNDKLTGEVLLDETIKMMKVSEKLSVATWINLLSGETWNVTKIGYQLKQVRERLAKGLVDKGVLRTEKRYFLLFDMTTHPVADMITKEEIIKRVCTTLVNRVSATTIDSQSIVPYAYLRTVCMICVAYAANVLENALLYLQPDLREQAYSKVDELMNDFSSWPFTGTGAKIELLAGTALSLEVVAAVLSVFTKMDTIVS
ncbi:Golgi phosphoprotein 3-domain-containing protein [Dichotomocladium elegans]|nr:Golgi phosphoprotein 3-domain-containing protein [Dichotomocladium elegans]